MIVDNFDILKDFVKQSCFEQGIDFDKDPDSYYEIRIMTRNKDFGETGHNKDFAFTYHVYKLSDLDMYKENVIQLCDLFNGRAYFSICRKSIKRVLLNCNIEIAKCLASGANAKAWKVVERISNSDYGSKDRKWVIDVDTKESSYIRYILKTIKKLGGKYYCEVPTPHGLHIISSPFRLDEYKKRLNLDKKQFSDIKKNHLTLLYANLQEV